jgi:leader peptidase (prepilin peptidase)/N-methyltransferase
MTVTTTYRTIAVGGGLVACVLAAAGLPAWAAVAVAVGVGVGVVAVDVADRRIPTRLVVIGAAAGVASVAISCIVDSSLAPVLDALGGAVLVGGAFALVHLLHPAGLGFGDVRLAALVGGLVAYGAASVAVAVLVAAIAAVAVAVATVAARTRSAPMAPYLLGAAVLVLVVTAAA